MKRNNVLFLIVMLFFLTVLFAACSGDDERDPGSFVSFKFDDIIRMYRYGFMEPEYGGSAFGNLRGFATTVVALKIATYLSNGLPDSFIMLHFMNVTNSSGAFLSASNAHFQLRHNGTNFIHVTNTLAVSRYYGVGGYIAGVFTAVVYSPESGKTNMLSDGVIRVKRIADNMYKPDY